MEPSEFLGGLLYKAQPKPGSALPPLPPGFSQTPEGLLVAPGAELTLLNFGGAYLVFSEYAPLDGLGEQPHKVAAKLRESFAAGEPFREMMAALAALNHFAHYPDQATPAIQTVRAALQPEPQQRFDNRLSDRQVFARQPILKSMRLVLSNPNRPFVRQHPPGLDPIFLVHATGDAMTRDDPHSDDQIGGLPDDFVMDIVANWTFHEGDDHWALMTRQAMLWRVHGDEAKKQFGSQSAVDLLAVTTGLEPEDFLAFGFSLIAHAMQWSPEKPSFVDLTQVLDKAPAVKRDAFVDLVCGTPDYFTQVFSSSDKSQWDLLAFESRPILNLNDDLLVLDESLLWERVTAGLYWFVFDSLKATKGYPEAEKWTRAWGDVVEATVGDMLQACALKTLDGVRLLWDEKDIWKAYGNDRPAADFVVDRGDRLIMFEVVSGQLTTNTRINLTRAGFDADIEKLVMSKVVQLDGSARSLLIDEEPLTGVASTGRHVIPVVVAAMGFPYIEPVVKHVRQLLKERGLLQDARIEELCIIDLRELEVLEGAAENGRDPATLLLTWQQQTQNHPLSFWNWVTANQSLVGGRPRRMRDQGQAIFDDIVDRLQLEGDIGAPWDDAV
jgi:hypothetical protein